MRSYKTTCPKCGHESLYVTPHNGMSYCFRATCHHLIFDGKAVHEAPKRSDHIAEIRDIYKQLAAYYHSALDTKAITYVHSRGITDNTIQTLQLGYCPIGSLPIYKTAIAKEAGIATGKHTAFLGDRITFPYFKNADIITDIRGRTINPDEEISYLSPYGGVIFRGAIFPYNNQITDTAKELLITESEIKAIAAIQAGYHAIGIPGISAWRKGFIQQEGQKVIIVFDNESDADTRRNVYAAIDAISVYIDDPYIATLPLHKDEHKAEVDTFILNYGEALFRKVINAALPYHTWKSIR
jgi:DNA primase